MRKTDPRRLTPAERVAFESLRAQIRDLMRTGKIGARLHAASILYEALTEEWMSRHQRRAPRGVNTMT
jgi:hypothetical protein